MKDGVQARLSVKDIQGMSERQFKVFLKWLHTLTEELETEDRAIYAKNPRWTLYK